VQRIHSLPANSKAFSGRTWANPSCQDSKCSIRSPEDQVDRLAVSRAPVGSGPIGSTSYQMDLGTRKVATLPESQGLWSPRWSPRQSILANCYCSISRRKPGARSQRFHRRASAIRAGPMIPVSCFSTLVLGNEALSRRCPTPCYRPRPDARRFPSAIDPRTMVCPGPGRRTTRFTGPSCPRTFRLRPSPALASRWACPRIKC
jgi:hypothetical protein